MLEIRQLDPAEYKGRNYIFEYQTPGYYDLLINEWTFQFVYKEFNKIEERKFEDRLLRDWLEQPVLYGAFVDRVLGGIIEGSIESWNNRFRISNILIFEGYRKKHIGTALIEYMVMKAKEQKARMMVLETQSCNIPAIRCYLKNGFKVIGFDTHAYSDTDLEKHEIRIEMGKEI